MYFKSRKSINATPVGYVWCNSHKEWEAENDSIDYQVSDTWRGHYYELGRTPYHSASYQSPIYQIAKLLVEIRDELTSRNSDNWIEERPMEPEPSQLAPQVKSRGGAIDL